MQNHRIQFVLLTIATVLAVSTPLRSDTWRLEQGQDLKLLSSEQNGKFLLAVSETKKLVSTGQTKEARIAFDKLKNEFPEIAGPDLDLFIEAEMFFCEGQYTKAVHTYDKLLTDHPESRLREAALDREFAIGTAFLSGQKRRFLRLFSIKGYAEGAKIMDKITEQAGIDSPLGLKAALAAAKHYEEREQFDEAYLKWWEISLQWETGQLGRDALLGMARCKHAAYIQYPENKRHAFDISGLKTAKTYYEKFKLIYPQDAERMDVNKALKQIDEQLANKQLSTARYYQRTGHNQAANLYYQMLATDTNWQQTQAAQTAKQLLTQSTDAKEKNK